MKEKAIFYHAGCPVCVDAERQLADALDRNRFDVESVHLGELFAPETVAVIGLHTVFEHHSAMTPTALEAFLHEYRITIPVGVDAPAEDGSALPQTMRRYDLQGTPTTALLDRDGKVRRKSLGHIPDLRLGAEIMALVSESPPATQAAVQENASPATGFCPATPRTG